MIRGFFSRALLKFLQSCDVVACPIWLLCVCSVCPQILRSFKYIAETESFRARIIYAQMEAFLLSLILTI